MRSARVMESSGPSSSAGATARVPRAVMTAADASRAGRQTVDSVGPPPRHAFSLSTTLLPPTWHPVVAKLATRSAIAKDKA